MRGRNSEERGREKPVLLYKFLEREEENHTDNLRERKKREVEREIEREPASSCE